MVLHIITGLNDGGAEGVLSRICLADPKSHSVISLMGMGKYGCILKDAGVDVYCMHIDSKKVDPLKVYKLYKLIKKLNPSVVQTWMYHGDFIGGTVAKLAGVPNVFWGIRHSNLSKGTIKKSTYVVMKACAVLSYLVPKKIVSCSRSAVESHIFQGYNKNIFELVQNGYDLSKFKPFLIPFDKMIFTPNTVPIISMVARFDIQKDHDNLIKAFSILKDKAVSFHLVLVGTNMDKNNVELLQMINNSSLSVDKDVTLFGQCNDIPLLMNSVNLNVLSSLGEAFPNVLAEAMACGTPCVTTDVGDASEIVMEHGWVVPKQNSQKLALAIIEALDELKLNPLKWKNRQEDCIDHIQKEFEIHSMIRNFQQVWISN